MAAAMGTICRNLCSQIAGMVGKLSSGRNAGPGPSQFGPSRDSLPMTMSMSFGALPISDGHRRRVHEGLAHPELRRRLAALLRRRVPQSEVADLMQTVLCDALASEGAPADPDELARWVTGIARHKVADFRRRSGRFVADEHVCERAPPEPPAPFEARQILSEVLAESGTARDRETLEWIVREHAGEALNAIAAEEGLPSPAVRQRVSRLRRALRSRFAVVVAAAFVALLGLGLAGATRLSEAPSAIDPDITSEPRSSEVGAGMTGTWGIVSYTPPDGLPARVRSWLDREAATATVRIGGGQVIVFGKAGTLVRSIGAVESNDHGTRADLVDARGHATQAVARPVGKTLVVTLTDGPLRGTVTLGRK
jgi:DNA-directed RNA polymerase specialized sigma24 family protein